MNLTASQDLERTASDEELMLASGRGDLSAFEELVLRYQSLAWNATYRILGDPAEAEDSAQEAFLRVWASAKRYRPRALFRTYLYRVLTRICIDRSSKRKPIYSKQIPEVADHRPPPLCQLLDEEREKTVRTALDRLSPHQRMAVVLKYFEGLRYSDIAKIMEISTKAVERLLARARERLEQDLAALLG